MYCLWFENFADFKSYGRAEMLFVEKLKILLYFIVTTVI